MNEISIISDIQRSITLKHCLNNSLNKAIHTQYHSISVTETQKQITYQITHNSLNIKKRKASKKHSNTPR